MNQIQSNKEDQQRERSVTPEITEKQIEKNVSFEKLRWLGRKIIEKIRKKTKETITDGEKKLKKQKKSVNLPLEVIEKVEEEQNTGEKLAEIQMQVKKESQEAERKISEVTENKLNAKIKKLKEKINEYKKQ